MDYRSCYRLSGREKLRLCAASVLLTAAVSYLFYDSPLGLAALPVCACFLYRRFRRQGLIRQQQELAQGFLDALSVLSGSLLAGYSVENAWVQARDEVVGLHGKKSAIGRELIRISRSAELNLPAEELLEDFAVRSGVEDIATFSEVFSFARHSGGDFIRIIGRTHEHLRAKVEVEQEIRVQLAARRLEQRIMTLVPLLLLAYLKISSLGFLGQIYGTPFGVIFMSLCLAGYLFAVWLGERLMRIPV